MSDRPVAASPRIDWGHLPDEVRSAIEARLGGTVVSARTQSGGFSPGTAARVVTADGGRAFVKAVSADLNPDSVGLHRAEARALALLPPEVPAPKLLDRYDDGHWVALVLEDVEGRHPKLPWGDQDAERVAGALSTVAGVRAPDGLPAYADTGGILTAWDHVVADPHGVDAALLARLPEWLAHQRLAREVTVGDAVVHWDARADNVLIRADGAVVLLDWAWACRGAPWLDTLLLAVDFVVQGGPDADDFLAASPVTCRVPREHLVAVLACMVGFWTDRARQPAPPGLPTIRAWQAHCGDAALGWLDRGGTGPGHGSGPAER